jgi:chromosome segregation ATPase
MTRFILLIMVTALLLPLISFAQDEDEIPAFLLKARETMGKVQARSADTKPFADDVLDAENYLKLAESEFKKNISSWSRKLKPEAEPFVRHYAAMAELKASIILSRIAKKDIDAEKARLGKSLDEVKAKIKIFDDKNIEIERLKKEVSSLEASISEKGGQSESLSKEIASLKSEQTQLLTQIKSLNEKAKAVDELVSLNKKLKADLDTLKAQMSVEFKEVQKQLADLKKEKELIMEMAKIGMLTKVTSDGITMIMPRKLFIKTTPKGSALASNSDAILGNIAKLMQNFQEYKVIIKVYGFGKPAKS